MTVSDAYRQRTQALALLKLRGMTRLAEFNGAGITDTSSPPAAPTLPAFVAFQ
jgi:hypothetical protein